MSASPQPATTRRREPNRLAGETSPYLLQHAYNPVNWYPWGDEALRKAREQNCPIFLSIGYSACHWCHVMEHESFEDPQIASFLNSHFINIKVDREERPDLDQIYMNAIQLLTRHGGWPMSVFLTPDLKPFYGGTYWPPRQSRGMPGFLQVLEAVNEAWQQRRTQVLETAQDITITLQQIAAPQGDRIALSDQLLQQATTRLLSSADRRNGGFGHAPKFPHPIDIRLLLRAWKRFQDEDALATAQFTLRRMADGGMYDHLGGGFHRYSTDERWLVPHFEKMLYDNALLVPAYLEAYQITNDPFYARVARETLDYVLREMTQPQGGFYSTQDADSEGVEGKFFVWTVDEIIEILGPDDASVFTTCYDVTPTGNWEGHTILNRPLTEAAAARSLGLDETDLQQILARGREKLFAARAQRIPPGRDDKVLTSWNGMQLSALVFGAQALNEPKYAEAAKTAADFLLGTLRQPDGRLWHSYKDGQAKLNGYLDDYACLIDGLVDVYQITFDPRYLEASLDLAGLMRDLFHDEQAGGFFYTATNHEPLITRNKDGYDGSTPSGNSVAATALLRLGRLCGRSDLEEVGVDTLEFLTTILAQSPTAASQALLALDFHLGPTYEWALVDGDNPADTAAVLQALHRRFLPNKVIARRFAGLADADLSSAEQPLLKGKTARGNQITAYLCQHGTCGLPTAGVAAIEATLTKLA